MKRTIPLAKQSKKAQKAYYAKQRCSWHGVDPVTKTVPSGKAYNRTKARQEARSLIRNGGKEWANGASARRCSCGSYGI